MVVLSSAYGCKTVFCYLYSHFTYVPKIVSFATHESLFFAKGGKVTFSARKSLPCRYSALSLQLETDRRLPLPDSFFRSAFAMPSSCLRFRRRKQGGGHDKAERILPLKHPTKDRGEENKSVWLF